MSLQHVLLGLLQTPSTGYDLGREFEEGARHFWFAELSQIYPTLKRLEEKGWATSRKEPSRRGPERRVYELTDDGRAELRRWLGSEPRIGRERLAYVAQAFFLGALEDDGAAAEMIGRMRSVWQQKLAYLEHGEREWEAEIGGWEEMPMEAFHPISALRLGIHQYRAKLAWCDETLTRLEARRSAAAGASA